MRRRPAEPGRHRQPRLRPAVLQRHRRQYRPATGNRAQRYPGPGLPAAARPFRRPGLLVDQDRQPDRRVSRSGDLRRPAGLRRTHRAQGRRLYRSRRHRTGQPRQGKDQRRRPEPRLSFPGQPLRAVRARPARHLRVPLRLPAADRRPVPGQRRRLPGRRRDRPLEARRQRHLEPRRLAGHPEQPLHQRLQRLRPRQPRQGRLVEPLGPGRQLPPQPRAGADPRGEEPVRPRTAVQQPDLHLPERLRPALHRSLRAHPVRPPQLQLRCRRGRPAGMAGKPVDGCPATRSGSPARFRRRPDLAGCWAPGAMQPITPLAPHPFAQEDTA